MGPQPKRKLDYDDYVAAPDDGQRYEIVRGELYVTPAPGTLHQRVLLRLAQQLVAFTMLATAVKCSWLRSI